MRPIHEKISETLRARIRAGELPIGGRLPTEAELMDEFGVARGTVRRALRTLNEQGLVHSLRGKGTYVRSGRPEPSIAQAFVGLSESLAYSSRSLTTEVLEQSVIRAGTLPADHPSGAEPTEVLLFLDRVRYLDDVPVARMHNWVRMDLAPGIDAIDFTSTALLSALDSATGGRLVSGRRTFEAVLPEEGVAASLQLSSVIPVLYLRQVSYRDDGEIVEFSDVWMDSRQVSVSMNLTR